MEEREILEKEVVTKEDGRTLTYYRFRPAPERSSKEGEQQA